MQGRRAGVSIWVNKLLQLSCAGLFALAVPMAAAQPEAQSPELFKTVHLLDTQLFDAYNNCDLETLAKLVADDLEFYHDQTGLAVGKAPFIAAIKQNICGKVQRTLVPGSLEVYPLKSYGAVEIGVHRFGHPGQSQEPGGQAKFVMLWQKTGDTWKLARVISYNHEPLRK